MFTWTQQERQVVLFLVAIVLLGHGLHFLKTRYGDKKIVSYIFAEDLGKINLNTASQELLMSVNGIGAVLAGRIIEYRKEKQGFRRLQELKNIKGITSYRFELIKDQLIVK